MYAFRSVTGKENSLIKLVSALQSSAKARRENGLFVLEGLRICDDAADNGIRFDKLIVSETALLKYDEYIGRFAENSEDCVRVPDSIFKKISDTSSPQGIIAVCKNASTPKYEIDPVGRYIVLENVADPSNLGAVSRTAEALGASGIILTAGGCDPYSPKALRASMGTLLRVPVIVTDNLPELISQNGLKAYACVVDKNASPISSVTFSDGCAVMIGNEANGLTESAVNSATQSVTIPMQGRAESLNAAAAAAIAVWEMMRQ